MRDSKGHINFTTGMQLKLHGHYACRISISKVIIIVTSCFVMFANYNLSDRYAIQQFFRLVAMNTEKPHRCDSYLAPDGYLYRGLQVG